jgi:hypothetical protein
MTNTNGPDDRDAGGKEKRPYTTLDLTADEVTPGRKDDRAGVSGQGSKEQLRLDKPESRPAGSANSISDSWTGLLTYAAAGAIGAALTLLVALWIFGNTDGSNSSGLSQAEVEALRTAITDTETRILALEADLKAAVEKTESTQTQQGDVTGLSERITALESRPATSGITQQSVQQSIDPIETQIAGIERRLSALESVQHERKVDGKSMAVSLAFYNLQRAAREGKPYALELKSVEENSPVPLDLAALEPWREQGVKSIGQLQEDFNAAVLAAIDAENQPTDDSLASEVWSRAKSFVRIRRKGDVEGEDTSALLARIEHRLRNGDLKAALAEAEKLNGPAAEAVAPWVAELKRKVAAEEALARIESKLLGTIGGAEAASRDG